MFVPVAQKGDAGAWTLGAHRVSRVGEMLANLSWNPFTSVV